MPFKSQQQRRFMYSQHPDIARRWERETPPGKLPRKKECNDPIAMERIPGGLGASDDPADFDQEQLFMGIQVELEHGNDIATAMEIAMDHLSEDPHYYSRLAGIEDFKPAPMPKLEDVYCCVDPRHDPEEPWEPGSGAEKHDLPFAMGGSMRVGR